MSDDSADSHDGAFLNETSVSDMMPLSLAALNQSTCSLINETTDAVKQGMKLQSAWSSSYVYWAKRLFTREGWHLQDMDIVFRL